jgi:hypothetical protein
MEHAPMLLGNRSQHNGHTKMPAAQAQEHLQQEPLGLFINAVGVCCDQDLSHAQLAKPQQQASLSKLNFTLKFPSIQKKQVKQTPLSFTTNHIACHLHCQALY